MNWDAVWNATDKQQVILKMTSTTSRKIQRASSTYAVLRLNEESSAKLTVVVHALIQNAGFLILKKSSYVSGSAQYE